MGSEALASSSSPISKSRRISRVILPKAAWSSIALARRSRSAPALASISARIISTMALAAAGGASPVRRSRTIRPITSGMGTDARSSIRARPLRSIAASKTTLRLSRTPRRALEPIASIRACSTASNMAAAGGAVGRRRAWALASWCDRRRAIWSARPRRRAASSGGRSRGGCGKISLLPTRLGPSPENTTSRSDISAKDRAALARARLKGSTGDSGLFAMTVNIGRYDRDEKRFSSIQPVQWRKIFRRAG